MKVHVLKKYSGILVVLFYAGLSQAGVAEDVAGLQARWAEANYSLTDDAQNDAFEALVTQADDVTRTYPVSAEAWIWNGIIKSSYAGVKGGLGALGLVKASREALERALSIDANAMEGSAYTSLGTLYFKVPGWPIAFGDDDRAEQLLKQALQVNPNGIDANYFYAEFLLENGDYEQAKHHLLKAKQAPPRPGRPLADKGRQQQISMLLATIDEELAQSVKQDQEF